MEEEKQVLIAPKGTRFVFADFSIQSEKAHIITNNKLKSFCGLYLPTVEVKFITCYEEEVCSECLTVSQEIK